MNCARNIITANFSGGTSATTAPLWQWDYGQVLCVTGIEDLPAAFEVHFSTNRAGGVSTVAVGADGQVTIPNVLLTIGKNLNAWIYLSDSEGVGETEYSITIPIKARPMPETYDAEVSGEFDDVVRQVSEYAETAQTAADNAGASASAAAASADSAAASASAAETAKTAAETAQGKAEDAQAAAETAAQTATQKAEQTAQDAAQAAQSKADAESAAQRAEAAQTGAESAKADAETAAQGAETAATAAENAATEAGQSATSAGQSATAAAGSATTAGNAAQTATTKAGEAFASADAAAASETAAQTAQTAAETAATNAEQSASTATTKAAEAAQSASNAAASETAAEAAATRAETAAASLVVDDALSETSENPVQNKVITGEVAQVKNAIDALKITDTASGAIASFPDGAAMQMESLTVEMNPIQDLHGYDSPWPAGGGKNLLDINNIVVGNTTNWSVDVNSDTLTVTHKTQYVTGTPTFAFNQPSGTYVVSIGSINITGQVSLYVNESWAKTINNGDTFTIDAANTNEIRFSAQESQSTIITKIQIESGSTATAWTPYSNICPITGRDEVNAWRTGVNLIDLSEKQATSQSVAQWYADGYTLRAGNTYTLSSNIAETTVYFSNLDNSSLASGSPSATYTPTKDTVCKFRAYLTSGIDNVELQLEIGSTATAYEPYQGQSVTVQLGQTVYGGTLDVTTGVLTVDRAMVDLGTLNWVYNSSGARFDGATLTNLSTNRTACICSQYRASNVDAGWTNEDKVCCIYSQRNSVFVKDTAYTDAATFKAAMSGVMLCYELAAPLEITLDPVTLNTLKGQNNVWSDGDSVTVDYVADPKLYIDKKITAAVAALA